MTIIAELGINHQGDFKKAAEMIRKAKEVGADIAKFQFYRPEEILGKDNPYLSEARACQFTWKQHLDLRDICNKLGIEWLVSLFHAEDVTRAVDAGMKRFKIASRAALDDELLQEIAKTNLPVILSNGLCNQQRLDVIKCFLPNPKTYLYCVSRYPTAVTDFDMNNMIALRKYAPRIGLSSHCSSIFPATSALSLGADVIEQHVVLDQNQSGCDVSSSISFVQLDQLVKWSKNIVRLVEITTAEQVEWIRQKRNLPEQYRYFRQDAPLSIEHQARWWKTLDKTRVKLFIIEKSGERIGYVGFNPLSRSARTAEFGIFILKEHQGKGLGRRALTQLLKHGFEDIGLSSVYSDTFEYPGETRFEFFRKIGFSAYPNPPHRFYRKQNKTVPSIKFFMTKDVWETINGANRDGRLEPIGSQAAV